MQTQSGEHTDPVQGSVKRMQNPEGSRNRKVVIFYRRSTLFHSSRRRALLSGAGLGGLPRYANCRSSANVVPGGIPLPNDGSIVPLPEVPAR